MTTKKTFVTLLFFLCTLCFVNCNKKSYRVNGWYHTTPGQKNCITREPVVTTKDSAILRLDSAFGKYIVIDSTTLHNKHFCCSIQDSIEYKKLEKALQKELSQPNISSKSSDYMKSDTYNAYKKYVCDNPEYINLMFQGFLFKDVKGLHGFLIDDIIQNKYPFAPSIRFYVNKTDSANDEALAMFEWKKKIKLLMHIANMQTE